MKRSKIFLGATTLLLAIAGLAAAKIHKIPQRVHWYATKIMSSNLICSHAVATRCAIGFGPACLYVTENGAQFQLFTRGSNVANTLVPCSGISRYNAQ